MVPLLGLAEAFFVKMRLGGPCAEQRVEQKKNQESIFEGCGGESLWTRQEFNFSFLRKSVASGRHDASNPLIHQEL